MFCKTITKNGSEIEKIITICKTKTQEIFHYTKKHVAHAKKNSKQSKSRLAQSDYNKK